MFVLIDKLDFWSYKPIVSAWNPNLTQKTFLLTVLRLIRLAMKDPHEGGIRGMRINPPSTTPRRAKD